MKKILRIKKKRKIINMNIKRPLQLIRCSTMFVRMKMKLSIKNPIS